MTSIGNIIKPGKPVRRRPLLFIALILSIPAFYMVLSGPTADVRRIGGALYGVAAIMIAIEVVLHARKTGRPTSLWNESALNILIVIGAIASTWPTAQPWSPSEWLLRLGLCSIVFARLSMLAANWIASRKLLQIMALAIAMLAISGGGFYWLEPSIRTYADGLWLAFVTGATVGYGDLTPKTPAARIFAVFIVLLGYAVFSVVTATIAAFFVGEDERRFEKELQADIRCLREEIAVLRKQLQQPTMTVNRDAADKTAGD